ncbi:GAF domain-containing protein [Xenorhabdus koppenhoeferi]|uniref:GAF domain-containing protein n=1 Tax=Xenorhabdus koppenhoeferi TaxID=351659 RepID=A0A1I7HZR1_9GAMM|nr:histidine kinase [Xenorhabdus koppenhoeferi]SFU66212.1 GAF domain-containing protein [Xenorhabdus koppenhoeferi]
MDKNEFYQELENSLIALLSGEYDFIATLANTSALLYERLDTVNWVGFYLMIACDAASNAEIVLPLEINGKIIGVLDIDSTVFGRFDENDENGLKALFIRLCEHLRQCVVSKYLQQNVT